MNGILLIDKEKDYTSRDIVNIISKDLNTKKVGHFGTLDPLATGLLVVGVGKYTKFGNILENETKEYSVEILIGKSTDTYDITGNVLEEKDVIINQDKIFEVVQSYQKKYLQTVPIYSAVKVSGKKLYEYARKNEVVELPKKEIEIYKINNIRIDKNILKFNCLVSKGTYIRSLINDISKDLNIPMCMLNLNRTKCGTFSIDNSIKINELKKDNVKFINIDTILNYKRIEISDDLNNLIINGNKIKNIYNEKRIISTKNKENIVLYEEKNDFMYPIFFF